MSEAKRSLPLYADPSASLDRLLEHLAPRYAIEFVPVSAGGVCLEMAEIANMRELLDQAVLDRALADAIHTLPLWAKIWPASLVLGHVLASLPVGPLLEIGAGCGLAGLVGAALGHAPVCISDINEDALCFARINALKNGLDGAIEVRRVDVGKGMPEAMRGARYPLILASEILYLEPLYRPLVKFLKRHLAPGGQAFLASDHRRGAKPFFKQAAREFILSERRIGVASRDDGGAERHLLVIHRLQSRVQPES